MKNNFRKLFISRYLEKIYFHHNLYNVMHYGKSYSNIDRDNQAFGSMNIPPFKSFEAYN